MIHFAVKSEKQLKIIVGAAETWQSGWYPTNEQWLELANLDDWKRVFKGRRLITHVVAEHVFEHLTRKECVDALRYISSHLVEGGRVRIAVPDGYHPNENYLRHVGVNGIGDDASDHMQLFTVDTLSSILSETGFRPVHIEGYDANGTLKIEPWSADCGFISRSRANKFNNTWEFVDANTSLIVDGIKV